MLGGAMMPAEAVKAVTNRVARENSIVRMDAKELGGGDLAGGALKRWLAVQLSAVVSL